MIHPYLQVKQLTEQAISNSDGGCANLYRRGWAVRTDLAEPVGAYMLNSSMGLETIKAPLGPDLLDKLIHAAEGLEYGFRSGLVKVHRKPLNRFGKQEEYLSQAVQDGAITPLIKAQLITLAQETPMPKKKADSVHEVEPIQSVNVRVKVEGASYDDGWKQIEATGPADLEAVFLNGSPDSPKDEVRTVSEILWHNLLALPEKASFVDVIGMVAFTVERSEPPKKQPIMEGDSSFESLSLIEVATVEPDVSVRQVYNGDLKKWVDSTPERQNMAMFLRRQIQAATLVQAVAIKRMHDDGLFVECGYATWTEFCEGELQMSDAYSRMLRRVADRFQGLLPDGWSNERALLAGPEGDNANLLSSLGPKKLYELTKLPEETDFSRVIKDAVITLPDGKTLSLEEAKAMSTRELSESLKETRRVMQDRIDVTEQARKKAEAERDTLKKGHEIAEQKYATGKELERLYGPAASQIEHKNACIDEARKHLNLFIELARKANVTTEDPATLRHSFFNLLNQGRDLVERLDADHAEITNLELSEY